MPANCSLPAWQTVPVPTTRIPAIPWCRGQQWCRRASSPGLWVPAARTGSVACGHARLLQPRDLANNCILLFFSFLSFLIFLPLYPAWSAFGAHILFLLQILVLVNWTIVNNIHYYITHPASKKKTLSTLQSTLCSTVSRPAAASDWSVSVSPRRNRICAGSGSRADPETTDVTARLYKNDANSGFGLL